MGVWPGARDMAPTVITPPRGMRHTVAVALAIPATAVVARIAVGGRPFAAGALVVSAVIAAAVRRVRSTGLAATRVEDAVPQLCRSLASAVGAGRSLRSALVEIAATETGALSSALGEVRDALSLGAPIDHALDAFGDRTRDPGARMLVAIVAVHRESGGELAAALRALARQLESRRRLERELRTATGQARATATLVAALPVLGGLAVETAAPGVLSGTLLTTPGAIVLGLSGALQAAGILAIVRIARGVR